MVILHQHISAASLLSALVIIMAVSSIALYCFSPDAVDAGSVPKNKMQVAATRTRFDAYLQQIHQDRYSNITSGTGRIFVAANLYNSERVLANMAAQLLVLADIMGSDRVFISIYENGSTDKTKDILLTLRYNRVVFLNDIFFCLPDIFELLHQSRVHSAHLTCAEDFEIQHGALAFYDTWVSRDILGHAFKSRYQEIAQDGNALVSQLYNRPFQVQCCWNGLAVIDARVFEGPAAIRFRRSAPKECSASECSLLCNDLWAAGYKRAVVVPRVKVSYDIATRDQLRQPVYFPHDAPFSDQNHPPKVEFKPGPKAVYCHPLNNPGSRTPDGPASFVALESGTQDESI
ncbi:cryptococcal mannosyltransferase 1-domain-containing protein [Kickxella alabastrina]|uniref:cryptococcal mannosyltransferase 1-domain-containing protein n=1 Tax=Kickxella alabastrina TaxID=61397 RepID=UPI00221FDD8F|nr:cryptococcal mannosyltransferase 1-domain-containing protein [Kickxella alabastrina]KAI7830904.1 cryptococcal mannosyltransferase 1-domain-containing protein [Kickxella alabastrina]